MSRDLTAASRALLLGNFAIGCGVMVVAGALNDIVRSLQVSVAVGGQLISAAAVVMAVGAPLLAVAVSGWDRRRLLVASLAWFAIGHALCALMPGYAPLLPVRAATVLGAAVFTPQAAAAISFLAEPAQRGRAMTFIFLGWSLSSVLGLPMAAFVGEAAGWRWAFALVALLSAGAAVAVWRALPDGIRPPALTLADWRGTLGHPLLMGLIVVTALGLGGQFTLIAYMAPYWRHTVGAGTAAVSALFLWYGALTLAGNLLLQRLVDRVGAARCVNVALACVAVSLAALPLATSAWLAAAIIVPWGLGGFASNSAQQARLAGAAPALAPALMALNTSAVYVGQAIGAGAGGALIAQSGFGSLHWAGLALIAAALGLSWLLARRMSGLREAGG